MSKLTKLLNGTGEHSGAAEFVPIKEWRSETGEIGLYELEGYMISKHLCGMFMIDEAIAGNIDFSLRTREEALRIMQTIADFADAIEIGEDE